jgi:tetratricopeptide (TPR) repeat protein
MRLLVVILSSSLALAQTAPTANDQEAAKAHFMAGSAYYEQANYNDAVKEFTEAYRLSQRPDLLYNIALAYERLEKWDDAIEALQKYLRDKPGAQDHAIIQTRIENLQKRKSEARAQPVAAPAEPQPKSEPPAKHNYAAGGALLGVGLAALAASIGTGASALNLKSELESVCNNKVCPPSDKSKADTGQALAISTDVLISVGAAAAIVGVVLLIVEAKRPLAKRVSEVQF